jgi:CRP-like cAMP-binding protein
MRDRKLQQIRQLNLFRELCPEEARRVARRAELVDVPAGHSFVLRGDPAREFAVVVEGVAAAANGRSEVLLAPGAWFGAVEIVTGRPHARDIRARTPMRVLVIERRAFVPLLDDLPGFARRLFRGVAERLTPQAQYAEAS